MLGKRKYSLTSPPLGLPGSIGVPLHKLILLSQPLPPTGVFPGLLVPPFVYTLSIKDNPMRLKEGEKNTRSVFPVPTAPGLPKTFPRLQFLFLLESPEEGRPIPSLLDGLLETPSCEASPLPLQPPTHSTPRHRAPSTPTTG